MTAVWKILYFSGSSVLTSHSDATNSQIVKAVDYLFIIYRQTVLGHRWFSFLSVMFRSQIHLVQCHRNMDVKAFL